MERQTERRQKPRLPMTDVNELRASEARFRQLAENIREVFYVIDPASNTIEYLSPAYFDVWGIDPDDLPADHEPLAEAVLPEYQEVLSAHRERRMSGEDSQCEFAIIHARGERRWILDRSFPVRDESGQLVRVVGLAEDITEEKQQQDRQKFLSDASKVLTGTLDFQETLRRFAYLAVPRIADWCAVYMENRDARLEVMEVVHADPRKIDVARDFYRRYPPDPANSSAYAVHRSGEVQWVREITTEILDSAIPAEEQRNIIKGLGLRSFMIVPLIARGARIGVMAFVYAESGRRYDERDVAFAEDLAGRAAVAADNARLFQAAQRARREAERREREEAALRKATQAVAATFSVEDIIQQIAHSALDATSADGSFVERVEPDANHVVVVAAAGEMSPGIGDSVPFEGSVAEYVLDRKQPEIIEVLGETRHPLPGALAQRYATSTALAVPLIDAGEAIGALILLRKNPDNPFTPDEADRAHTFGNLASLAFRKVHLLESSEERSRELERVMESRNRFVRGFSHDLKNPLGAADGHAALLEDGMLGELTEQQRSSVARIRAALKSAVDLINDLVQLARAEAGQLVLRIQPIDAREIVRELVEQYRPAAEQAGLSIKSELGAVDVVSSDSDRVRQVLGNLLSNAVKYTKSGGSVVVRTRMQPAPEGLTKTASSKAMVTVEVADTGIGIPEDKLGVLFTEFERIDPTVKPGAGLGLAISRRIARLLGGDVTAHTQRGAGSTFTLWLADREPTAPK